MLIYRGYIVLEQILYRVTFNPVFHLRTLPRAARSMHLCASRDINLHSYIGDYWRWWRKETIAVFRTHNLQEKSKRHCLSRDASTSTRNKARGLFVHLYVAHCWRREKNYVFIHYSAYIMYILHLPRQEQTAVGADHGQVHWSRRLRSVRSFIAAQLRDTKYMLASRKSAGEAAGGARERETRRGNEKKRATRSLSLTSERENMMRKQKRGSMRYIRVRSIGCWMSMPETILRNKISQRPGPRERV